VMLTGAVLSETVFNFFNVIVLLLLLWSPWRNDDGAIALPSDRVFLIAGAVAGLAILTRPPFAVSVVLVPIAIAVTARNWRVSLMRTGALLLGVFLVVAPWTARNAVTMNSFVPISTNTGYNLCMGHNPESSGTFAIPDYCFRDLPTDDTTKSEVQRDALTRSRAVRWMSGHILDEPRLALLKTWYLFADDQAGLDASRSYGNDNWLQPRDLGIWNTICDGYFFAVLGLAILGFLTWPIAGDRRRLVMLLLVAGVVVAVWLFFGDSRFKQPMLPILAIAAVVPLRALRHPPTAAVADAAAVPDESSPRTR